MARAHGARAQVAFAFESVYGTAPASGYSKLPFASEALGQAQPLIDNELLGYGRDPLPPIKDAVTVNGDMMLPLDTDALGFWLKLLFGAPTTTGTTPKTHTFASGAITLPSAAIEVGNPEVPDFRMYTGVRADTLSITLQRSGNLQAKIGLIAQGETPNVASQAGTLAALTLQRFGQFNGAIKRDGVALANIVSGDLIYSNGLDPIETIRSDGKIDGVDPGMSSLKGKIVTRFADTTLRTQAVNGTACELEFSWVIDAARSFKLTAHGVYLPYPKIEIPGPSGLQAEFDWQGAIGSVTPRLCTAVLVNSVAAY